jgi:antitoxin (DNA-binding transcriptional repressor) of toxin-antitoxin stability system
MKRKHREKASRRDPRLDGATKKARRVPPLTSHRTCVIMYDMKTATVRKVQHNWAEVLSWVERGEEVRVLRRKKVVARLVPPHPEAPRAPDFLARARSIWGAKPKGARPSELVSQLRGER